MSMNHHASQAQTFFASTYILYARKLNLRFYLKIKLIISSSLFTFQHSAFYTPMLTCESYMIFTRKYFYAANIFRKGFFYKPSIYLSDIYGII